MPASPIAKKFIGTAAAVMLCLSPTMARAATATPALPQVNPLVALSALGSPASATAVCGASTTVAAGAAVASQAQPGCVLPLVDQAPPPPVTQALPPPPPPPGGGIGLTPILLGLLGIAGIAALLLLGDDDDDDDEPLSPF
jgi:hypothetical protein